MATLYDKGSSKLISAPEPEALLAAIETFLATCRKPAILEYGDAPLLLLPGSHRLEIHSGRLRIDIWNEARSLSRRILTIERVTTGALDCAVQLFGGKSGRLTFLDLERPQTAVRTLRGSRENLAAQFRKMLSRQFPGWEIAALTSAMDLRRSFSAIFPRAVLSRGNRQVAAVMCPSAELESEFLSFALIWHDYLLRQADPALTKPLALFLPDGSGALTAHRLKWLTGRSLRAQMFRFNQDGMAGEVDGQDLGNLETRVSAEYVPQNLTPHLRALLSRLEAIAGVGCCPELSGAISIRARGFEFARLENGRIFLGIEAKEEIDSSHAEKVESFAEQLSVLGSEQAQKSSSVPSFAERWFESAVRSNLLAIDPDLTLAPVHGQVLTFAGCERQLLDLLALNRQSRLTILELKTAQDIHLPLQALDYWMRIGWHARRKEIDRLFPASHIAESSPKLLLVAPGMSFHPSNEIVLRYFSPDIEVERVGVNSNWDQQLKVVFRLQGSQQPISHRSPE